MPRVGSDRGQIGLDQMGSAWIRSTYLRDFHQRSKFTVDCCETRHTLWRHLGTLKKPLLRPKRHGREREPIPTNRTPNATADSRNPRPQTGRQTPQQTVETRFLKPDSKSHGNRRRTTSTNRTSNDVQSKGHTSKTPRLSPSSTNRTALEPDRDRLGSDRLGPSRLGSIRIRQKRGWME